MERLGLLLLLATFVATGALVVFPPAAKAQEGVWHEISVQGTGFFTKDSQGNGISQHSTDTGGLLASYRLHFNRWLAADANYGYDRNTQRNLRLGVRSTFSLTSTKRQAHSL